MVRLAGFCSATVARAPNPMSNSPSPVTTTTDLSGWALARPRPTVIALPMAAQR
ncbi:hypothetical protein D3C81_2225710 [compost metagenome]